MGKKTDRILDLEEELERVKSTNVMLENWRTLWMTGLNEEEQISLQTNMGALQSLFHKLKVSDMTSAVMAIKVLQQRPEPAASNSLVLGLKQDLADSKFHLDNARARIAGLINQQNGNDKTVEHLEWDMANLQARNGELEEALCYVSEILVVDFTEDEQFKADCPACYEVVLNLISHIEKMDVHPAATEEGDL